MSTSLPTHKKGSKVEGGRSLYLDSRKQETDTESKHLDLILNLDTHKRSKLQQVPDLSDSHLNCK